MIFFIFLIELLEIFVYFFENRWNTIQLNLLQRLRQMTRINISPDFLRR